MCCEEPSLFRSVAAALQLGEEPGEAVASAAAAADDAQASAWAGVDALAGSLVSGVPVSAAQLGSVGRLLAVTVGLAVLTWWVVGGILSALVVSALALAVLWRFVVAYGHRKDVT